MAQAAAEQPLQNGHIVVLAEYEDPLLTKVQAAHPAVTISSLSTNAPLEERRTLLANARVLLGPPDRLLSAIPDSPALQWAQSTWAGVAPLVALERRDYVLTALKGVFGQAMTEYLLAWLLAVERDLPGHLNTRCWNVAPVGSLVGKRLGILGTGSIGSEVALSLGGFGLRIVGLNSDGRNRPGFERCYATDQRLEFAAGLDYVFSVLPATAATDNVIDGAFLCALNPNAIVVNAGRGNAIHDPDLLTAIDSGALRAAVLDVFREEPLPESHPFWAVKQIYITSHTAAPTETDAAVSVFLDNLTRFETGQALLHRVDFTKGY